MRSTPALLQTAARLLILAFIAMALVTVGCAGSQAARAADTAITASAFQTGAAQDDETTVLTASTAVTADQGAASKRTACVPGRGTARVESNAIVPQPATGALRETTVTAQLPHGFLTGVNPITTAGRVPAALSHLDLGIVRT